MVIFIHPLLEFYHNLYQTTQCGACSGPNETVHIILIQLALNWFILHPAATTETPTSQADFTTVTTEGTTHETTTIEAVATQGPTIDSATETPMGNQRHVESGGI